MNLSIYLYHLYSYLVYCFIWEPTKCIIIELKIMSQFIHYEIGEKLFWLPTHFFILNIKHFFVLNFFFRNACVKNKKTFRIAFRKWIILFLKFFFGHFMLFLQTLKSFNFISKDFVVFWYFYDVIVFWLMEVQTLIYASKTTFIYLFAYHISFF